MKNKNQLINQTFRQWVLVNIILLISFIHYGNNLKKESNQNKALQKLRWTITVTTLLCIYITEQTIKNTQERRLINSIIIFSSTFSYLYYLAQENKIP